MVVYDRLCRRTSFGGREIDRQQGKRIHKSKGGNVERKKKVHVGTNSALLVCRRTTPGSANRSITAITRMNKKENSPFCTTFMRYYPR